MGKSKPKWDARPPPDCWMCGQPMAIDPAKPGKRIYHCNNCGVETDIRITG